MPDLFTHTAVAYFIVRANALEKYRALFYIGTVLPDVLSRPFYILFPHTFRITTAIHTPVFIYLFCLLLAQLFKDNKTAFIALIGGSALHFILDVFQRHIIGGYYWFFPFSWKSFEIGMFWPEDALWSVPFLFFLVIITETFLQFKENKN